MPRPTGYLRATALTLALAGGLPGQAGSSEKDLAGADPLLVAAGKALFERNWVAAPASVAASDGLGPLYNARGCAACHPKGGGISLGEDSEAPVGLVLRLSVATQQGAAPHPVYGSQLQDRGLAGIPAEGRLALDWEHSEVTLSGGETVMLRRPVVRVEAPGYGPLGDVMTSLRIAPPLYGLGLVDRVPDAEILAAADPDDADGDGISGRPNRDGRGALGRFGWKAATSDLQEQAAQAAALDIGLSSHHMPAGAGDCTPAETACLAAPDGSGPEGVELEGPALDLIATYLASLPPPGPRGEAEANGAEIFRATGCAACHRPVLHTGDGTELRPYSDFLLHDMGEDLADNRPEGLADGREWRTAPLWAMGKGPSGSPATFLHDGRARSPLEAILWHGGEAKAMRDKVISMAPEEREALLRFLDAL